MKTVMIWGAGRIGRGFAAEIFRNGGYELTYVDSDRSLVDRLNQLQKYTIYKLSGGQQDKTEISGFRAYAPEDTALKELFLSNSVAWRSRYFRVSFGQVAGKSCTVYYGEGTEESGKQAGYHHTGEHAARRAKVQ